MDMNLIKKENEEISFVADIDVSLANAIRRSTSDVLTLAIDEVDIYKNDSVLYDEIIAHRLGLVPLKNQKLKKDDFVEYKLKAKSKDSKKEVLVGELGDDVVYPEAPLVLIENGQEIELVARAKNGYGRDHSKFSPGVIFYKHLPKIKISGDGEKQLSLAESFPKTFKLDSGKLKVLSEYEEDIDLEDVKDYPGVSIEVTKKLIFNVESFGGMDAKDVFVESCKALKDSLLEVEKAIK